MVRTALNGFSQMMRLSIAAGISFLIFVLIARIHTLFGIEEAAPTSNAARPKIIAEYVKEKPTEEKKVQQRIRQTVNEGPKQGSSQQMAMRFSPDLSLDAGMAATGAEVDLQKQDLDAEILEEGQIDEPPQELSIPAIEFPPRARELGISGTVVVRFVVLHTGKATAVEIISSPHVLLSNEARRVILEGKYKPGVNKGAPVNSRVSKNIDFILE
ncbi:MAG: TonB family protein [Chitinivibrionales bacterium]|nr:TonB family protein [Chitinivibrionales bacterium]